MAQESESIRTEFLKLFVREIITNLALRKQKLNRIKERIKIYKGILPEEQILEEAKEEIQKQEINIVPQKQQIQKPKNELKMIGGPINSVIKEIEGKIHPSQLTQKRTVPLRPFPQKLRKQMAFKAQQNKSYFKPPRPSQPQLIQSIAAPRPRSSIIQKLNIIGMSKIENLLYDPTIQTLECPGPAKQVLVYKSGVIQATNISLTNEEINKIMNEISEKARIPLIPGIFKAAIGDFIVTAVISEFVGTRFIIQKKAPSPSPSEIPTPSY